MSAIIRTLIKAAVNTDCGTLIGVNGNTVGRVSSASSWPPNTSRPTSPM
jgi:hypothetical protein